MVSVAAVVYQPDLAVDPLQLGVRQTQLDGRQDPVAVGPDGLGEGDERRDATTACPAQTPLEMVGGVRGVSEPVEVTQPLFQLPDR